MPGPGAQGEAKWKGLTCGQEEGEARCSFRGYRAGSGSKLESGKGWGSGGRWGAALQGGCQTSGRALRPLHPLLGTICGSLNGLF